MNTALKQEVYGLCIHGLMGDVFSNSMNNLQGHLNKVTPAGCHFSIVGGNDPRVFTPMIEAGIDGALSRGAKIILIGHSLGADAVVYQCNRLQPKGIQIPLACPVDPVDWAGTSSKPGIWQIGANVDIVINPYQDGYPGGGHVVRADGNEHTDVRLMHLPQYPHASIVGLDIGSCPETQDAISKAVLDYIATLKGAPANA